MKLLSASSFLLLSLNGHVAVGSNIRGSGLKKEQEHKLGLRESDSDNVSNPFDSPGVDGDGAGAFVENQAGSKTLREDELREIISHLPSNSFLEDMSAMPGKGLGRNNLKALINSDKPSLPNSSDADRRDDPIPVPELPEIVWTPGEEAEPMGEDELQEIMSILPRNSIIKDVSTKPGRGLGKNNLKALINSGKPFLLNGLDADLRDDLLKVMKLKLEEKNQPYMLVIPYKTKGGLNFHLIEAVAPNYEHIEGETFSEKRRNFLRDFLRMSDREERRAALTRGESKGKEGRRRLNDEEATPTRQIQLSSGPYYFGRETPENADIAMFWETKYLDFYQLTNGRQDIQIVHKGNWGSSLLHDGHSGDTDKMGWANGHSSLQIIPPSGYIISDYLPKNVNEVTSVRETTGFTLSGKVRCTSGETGTCNGEVGASRSQSTVLSYNIQDWEILANGYGIWDFKQANPFKVYGSPMTYGPLCFAKGGCFHELPALSRGTFNHEASAMITSEGTTGLQTVEFVNTGNEFMYLDGWFGSSSNVHRFVVNSNVTVNVDPE